MDEQIEKVIEILEKLASGLMHCWLALSNEALRKDALNVLKENISTCIAQISAMRTEILKRRMANDQAVAERK